MVNVDWTFYWIVKLFNKPHFSMKNIKSIILEYYLEFCFINKKNVDSFYFLLILRKIIKNQFLKTSSFVEMINLYLFSINNNTNKIDREIINQHFNSND